MSRAERQRQRSRADPPNSKGTVVERWTPAEEAQLRGLYADSQPAIDWAWITGELTTGRAAKAVQTKAGKMGLRPVATGSQRAPPVLR